MTRRRTNSNPVSLFPFLAVLLSAMGALILLLVVVSRQAQRSRDWELRSAANQELTQLGPLPERITFPSVEPVPPLDLPPLVPPDLPPLPEIKDPRPALEAAKREIEAQLRDVSSKTVDRRNETQQLDRLAELRQRLQLLQQEIQRIEKAKELAENEKKSAESTLKQLDARWSKAKATADKADNRFSIVPYFGNNASEREPIYIECQQDRMIVQPEGVEITPLELGNPLDPDNTLAAVVRALLTSSRARGEQPYPLLVVRPDGIATYYIARLALGGVRTEYGYELVAKDVSLDFGKPDQQTKQITQAIVNDAKSKVRRRPGALPENDWNLSSVDGGPDDEPASIRDLRSIRTPTREQLESIARGMPAVPGPGDDEDAGSGPTGNSYASAPIGNDGGERDGRSEEEPVPEIDGASGGLDGRGELDPSRLAEGSQTGTKGLSNHSDAQKRGGPSKDGFAQGTLGRNPPPLGPSAADRLSGLGVPRRLGSATRGDQDEWSTESAEIASNNQARMKPSRPDLPSNNSRDGGWSASGTRADSSADVGPLAESSNNLGSRRSTGSNSRPSESSKPSGQSNKQNSSTSNSARQGEGAPSASSPDEFQQALMEAAGGGGSSSMTTPSNMPVPSMTLTNRKNQKPDSDDEQGGDENASGTPILGPTGSIRETIHKRIVVECRASGVTLYPGGEFIKFDSPSDVTTARAAIYKHVAQQMLAWGPPSEIHRWAPVVEFNVRPDGLDRYYDLRFSMTSSGLDVQHQLLSWKDDVDFSEVFGGRRAADEARRRSAEKMIR
jgi:hypothetical protein